MREAEWDSWQLGPPLGSTCDSGGKHFFLTHNAAMESSAAGEDLPRGDNVNRSHTSSSTQERKGRQHESGHGFGGEEVSASESRKPEGGTGKAGTAGSARRRGVDSAGGDCGRSGKSCSSKEASERGARKGKGGGDGNARGGRSATTSGGEEGGRFAGPQDPRSSASTSNASSRAASGMGSDREMDEGGEVRGHGRADSEEADWEWEWFGEERRSGSRKEERRKDGSWEEVNVDEEKKKNKRRDFYAVLGISFGASDDQIRSAYLRLALRCHPDKHGGSEEAKQWFQEVSEAYHVLSDACRRRDYDEAMRNQWQGEWTPDQLWDFNLEEYLARFTGFILTTSGLGLFPSPALMSRCASWEEWGENVFMGRLLPWTEPTSRHHP